MAGGDMLRLKELLYHNCLDMVKEYVEMYAVDLKQNYNQFNALENFKGHGEYISMHDK